MTPNLIETSTKNYLFNNLQHCHHTRVNMYYYALNIGIFLLFVIVAYFILYSCSKNKISDYEKQQQMIKDQEMVDVIFIRTTFWFRMRPQQDAPFQFASVL